MKKVWTLVSRKHPMLLNDEHQYLFLFIISFVISFNNLGAAAKVIAGVLLLQNLHPVPSSIEPLRFSRKWLISVQRAIVTFSCQHRNKTTLPIGRLLVMLKVRSGKFVNLLCYIKAKLLHKIIVNSAIAFQVFKSCINDNRKVKAWCLCDLTYLKSNLCKLHLTHYAFVTKVLANTASLSYLVRESHPHALRKLPAKRWRPLSKTSTRHFRPSHFTFPFTLRLDPQ